MHSGYKKGFCDGEAFPFYSGTELYIYICIYSAFLPTRNTIFTCIKTCISLITARAPAIYGARSIYTESRTRSHTTESISLWQRESSRDSTRRRDPPGSFLNNSSLSRLSSGHPAPPRPAPRAVVIRDADGSVQLGQRRLRRELGGLDRSWFYSTKGRKEIFRERRARERASALTAILPARNEFGSITRM